jgi:hypothetical protein
MRQLNRIKVSVKLSLKHQWKILKVVVAPLSEEQIPMTVILEDHVYSCVPICNYIGAICGR